MKTIKEQIADKKRELAELERQEKLLDEMSPIQKLAITLHSLSCKWNHSDGCSWYYEISNSVHNWNAQAHKEYLAKAVKLCEVAVRRGLSEDELLSIYQEMEKL